MNTLVPPRFDLGRNITLATIEEQLESVARDDLGEGMALVHLARHLGSSFFVDSWVSALIGTLSRKAKLKVRDWHSSWERSEIDRFFKGRLPGFVAVMNASEIDNDSKERLPVSPAEVRTQTNAIGGILERHIRVEPESQTSELLLPGLEQSRHPVGRSFTVCCVDTETQRTVPFVFGGMMQDRERFASTFLRLKRRHFERGETSPFDHADQLAAEHALATFVFETFQNSYEHGCLDAEGHILPGVRSILLRKHSANDSHQFAARAKGFPALEAYLRHSISGTKHRKLLEVSVSDQGSGILNRFLGSEGGLSTGPSLTQQARRTLLQDIFETPLTSKGRFPGAGQGLAKATEAVRALQGFLTVRTDRVWLSYRPDGQDYGYEGIDAAPVAGTHINLLFPLRS